MLVNSRLLYLPHSISPPFAKKETQQIAHVLKDLLNQDITQWVVMCKEIKPN